MNRDAVLWLAAGIAVFGLAAVSLMLGRALLPPRMTAQTKGTLIPWVITWGMIWGTALIGIAVAGFLIVVGVGKIRSRSA
jgi:hypothetical protein